MSASTNTVSVTPKEILEEHLASYRERETNALLLARLLQGKVTELHASRTRARREAARLRQIPRMRPNMRQGSLGAGEMRVACISLSEDIWADTVSLETS